MSQGTVAFGAGCWKSLAWFALSWAAVAAGLYALFQMRYETEPARIAALAGGGLVILLSGFFTRGLSRAREAVSSLRSGAGAGPPASGVQTFTGRITPTGKSLVSPVSGTACVAYHYETYTLDSDGDRRAIFSGFALTPCEIRGVSGSVRLLGMPLSDDLKPLGNLEEVRHGHPDAAAFERLRGYLATAEVKRFELSVRDFKKAFQGVLDVLKDSDASIRDDSAAPGADPTLAGQMIAERFLPPGAEVTVTGLYSAETGGFVNDADWTSSRRLRLVLGGRNETTSALWKQAAANLVGGAFLIAFVLGLVLLFLEKEAGPKESVLVNVFDAVGKDDAALATRCIEAQTLNLNLPGGGGKTPLVLARSAAMTKLLLKAGADANRKDLEGTTPLVSAVRRGDSEATRLLLAAGANPNEPDAKKSRTPLDWALMTRSEEIAEILRQAGARSEP